MVALFVLVVVAFFLLVVHMDFTFHSKRRVGRFHDNRRKLVFDSLDRPIHPRLKTDPVHDDHVGIAKIPQLGRCEFVAVRLESWFNEHSDLGQVAADTFGEVTQRVDGGNDLKGLRSLVARHRLLGGS